MHPPSVGIESLLSDFRSVHALNPCSQISTQEPTVRRFVGRPADGSQPLVDGCRRQTPSFQLYSVTSHDDAVESQAWLRTVPGDKFFNRMFVGPPRRERGQAVEHCGLGMIEVGEPKRRAAVLGFGLIRSDACGLPPQRGITAQSAAWRGRRIGRAMAISCL
jgi:hypothetical protein